MHGGTHDFAWLALIKGRFGEGLSTIFIFIFLNFLSCLAEPNIVLLSTRASKGEKLTPSIVDLECHSRRVFFRVF